MSNPAQLKCDIAKFSETKEPPAPSSFVELEAYLSTIVQGACAQVRQLLDQYARQADAVAFVVMGQHYAVMETLTDVWATVYKYIYLAKEMLLAPNDYARTGIVVPNIVMWVLWLAHHTLLLLDRPAYHKQLIAPYHFCIVLYSGGFRRMMYYGVHGYDKTMSHTLVHAHAARDGVQKTLLLLNVEDTDERAKRTVKRTNDALGKTNAVFGVLANRFVDMTTKAQRLQMFQTDSEGRPSYLSVFWERNPGVMIDKFVRHAAAQLTMEHKMYYGIPMTETDANFLQVRVDYDAESSLKSAAVPPVDELYRHDDFVAGDGNSLHAAIMRYVLERMLSVALVSKMDTSKEWHLYMRALAVRYFYCWKADDTLFSPSLLKQALLYHGTKHTKHRMQTILKQKRALSIAAYRMLVGNERSLSDEHFARANAAIVKQHAVRTRMFNDRLINSYGHARPPTPPTSDDDSDDDDKDDPGLATKIEQCRSRRVAFVPPQLRAAASSTSDDVQAQDCLQNNMLTLTCPITLGRIHTPARFDRCNHLDCFDFDAYIAMIPKGKRRLPGVFNKWKCPICRTKYDNIASYGVCAFMSDVLADLCAKYNMDAQEDDDSDSDSDDGANGNKAKQVSSTTSTTSTENTLPAWTEDHAVVLDPDNTPRWHVIRLSEHAELLHPRGGRDTESSGDAQQQHTITIDLE